MTSQPIEDFISFSKEIAKNFLQTVVVVDDGAYFEKCEETAPSELIPPQQTPSFRVKDREETEQDSEAEDSVLAKDEPVSDQKIEESDEAEAVDEAHELNAKELIDDFAKKGILCAVIRPKDYEVESLGEKVYPLARRSDILVFDWVLEKSDLTGAKVKEMISKIISESSESGSRLRLIAIYTGQAQLDDIVEELKTNLVGEGGKPFTKKDDFTLTSGPVRIAVYAKGHVKGIREASELAARKVDIEDLPERLIAEFVEMTMGLVSNVALQSLAGLRDNTHRILSKFHPGMDAPFLAHRAMLEKPDDANDLLVYLVGSEMAAILSSYDVGKIAEEALEQDIIRLWLKFRSGKEKGLAENFSLENTEKLLEDIYQLLRKGVKEKSLIEEFKKFTEAPHKADLTAKLCCEEDSPQKLEYEFAILTTLKSTYLQKEPVLRLGTILKEIPDSNAKGAKPRYWVCVQPLCDSVRIEGKRAFPFLKMSRNDNQFDLVLPDNGDNYVKVRICYRPYESRLIEFKANDTGVVRGDRENNKYVFTDTGKKKYEWVAELKFEHAQRIVNKYANEQSRVGLDESEWLRLSALKISPASPPTETK